MAISDLPIFSMLRTKMEWHQERQRVLSENVANADTPNFKPSDLTPPDFNQTISGSRRSTCRARTPLTSSVAEVPAQAAVSTRDHPGGAEVRPAGNSVSLEDEMLKVASNQMDYQAATALYTRGLGLIKTALGRR